MAIITDDLTCSFPFNLVQAMRDPSTIDAGKCEKILYLCSSKNSDELNKEPANVLASAVIYMVNTYWYEQMMMMIATGCWCDTVESAQSRLSPIWSLTTTTLYYLTVNNSNVNSMTSTL